MPVDVIMAETLPLFLCGRIDLQSEGERIPTNSDKLCIVFWESILIMKSSKNLRNGNLFNKI